jgi:hypothetical protein
MIRSLNWTPVAGEDPKEAVKAFPERFAAEAFAMPQAELAASGWQLEPQAERQLLARIRAGGTPLGKLINGRVTRGITTGLNDAFVVDDEERVDLISCDPAVERIIVPYLGGREVKRWHVEPSGNWIIKIESSANVKHPWTDLPDSKAEERFRETWPSVFKRFTKGDMRSQLIKRDDKGRYYWELRSCAYWEHFSRPKLVSTKISSMPTFAIDHDGYVLANTSYLAQSEAVTFITAVLNSSLSNYVSRQIFATKQGGFYEVQPDALESFPIPNATRQNEQLISLVAKALHAGAERPRLETLINAFVYELFFADELHARDLRPFAAAEAAGLMALANLEGPALAHAADTWSRCLADPASPLYATLFDLQSVDAVRIIEGR